MSVDDSQQTKSRSDFACAGSANADPANKFGGGDALMGNTRSHPEHDG